MPSRTRTQGPEIRNSGTRNIGEGTDVPGSYCSHYAKCQDEVGDFDQANPLTLYYADYKPCLMSGDNGLTGVNHKVFSSFPTASYSTGNVMAEAAKSFSWDLTASEILTKIVAQTNPSKPHIQLPVFFAELRDIPGLLKQTGQVLNRFYRSGRKWRPKLSEAANVNLAIQFGWAPLISDLNKMVGVSNAVEKRLEELRRLQEGNHGLRRKRSFSNKTKDWKQSNVPFNSYGATVRVNLEIHEEIEQWGTCRWYPSGNLPERGSDAERKMMTRYALGLDPSQQIQNLWDAMPWSWLADYFGTVGDFIAANNNSLAYSRSACAMSHGKRRITIKPITYPTWMEVSEGSLVIERKVRRVGGPSLSASLPILSNKQLSILGSLAITKSGIKF